VSRRAAGGHHTPSCPPIQTYSFCSSLDLTPTSHFSMSSPNSRPKIKISSAHLSPFHTNSTPNRPTSTHSNHPAAARVSAPTLKFLQPCHQLEPLCYNRSWRVHLHRRKRTLLAPYRPCHGAQHNSRSAVIRHLSSTNPQYRIPELVARPVQSLVQNLVQNAVKEQ
jgi:hypothetical protein